MRTNGKQFCISILVIIFFSQLFALPSFASVTTVKLYPIADTYVDAQNPDKNFGSSDRFEVREEYYNSSNNIHGGANAYLKFDMSKIPHGVTIINANLSEYLWKIQGECSNCSVSVHYCSDNSWNEALITWNNAPNFEPQAIDMNNHIASVLTRYSWDVTDAVIITLVNHTISLVMKAIDVPTSSLIFWSKEYTQTEAPILYINYIDEQPNISPTAGFSYSPLTPTINDTIQFIDTSSDIDGTIVSWSWNFGDGTSSISKNPVHKYPNSGTYIVNLYVTDNDNATNTRTIPIPVSIGSRNDGTPGFDFIFALCAIVIVLFFSRKKRSL